jgi:hypothetical protein
MNKETKASIIILIISIITLFLLPGKYEFVYAVIASIIAACIGYLLKSVITDFHVLKMIFLIYLKRTYYIRFSIAYLYRIQIRDKYLLVKSNRIQDFFQPVGGTYKYFKNAGDKFKKWGIRKDDKIKVDEKSDGDLRLDIPKRNVIKFIHWFQKGENREISCFREFYEELINENIITRKNFPFIQYRKIRKVSTGLQFSKYFNCWEILIFDIVEPVLNKAQEKELEEIYKKGDGENYIWVDAKMIDSGGYCSEKKEQEFRIGTQTKYII